MTELKCPFCGQELERDEILGNSQPLYYCKDWNCERTKWLSGTPEFWQALIDTKKKLDIAVDALDTVRQYKRGTALIYPDDIAEYCDRKIEQINQKD